MTFKANGALFKNTPEKLQERFKDRYDPSPVSYTHLTLPTKA